MNGVPHSPPVAKTQVIIDCDLVTGGLQVRSPVEPRVVLQILGNAVRLLAAGLVQSENAARQVQTTSEAGLQAALNGQRPQPS